MTDLRSWIRDIPDFPKPGILFRDITPVLADATALRSAVVAVVGFALTGRLGTRVAMGRSPVRPEPATA